MKQLILILSTLFLLNCSKDPLNVESKTTVVENTVVVLDNVNFDFINLGKRNGTVDRIFFRKSFTSDNYVKSATSHGTIPREYEAFNKKKVAYIYFSPGIYDDFYFDVRYKHYTVKIVNTDSTFITDHYHSKDTVDYFKCIPTGEGVLTNNHQATKVSWTEAGRPFPNFNEYLNNSNLLNQWAIRFDGVFVVIKYKEPINKNSTKFQLPNVH